MEQVLSDCRVLVVEDEFFLALELEDALTMAGADVVGPLPDLGSALAQASEGGFDVAVVDLNLRGGLSFALADVLTAKGIPFVFATAYAPAQFPVAHRSRLILEKPYNPEVLIATLADLVKVKSPA
jgi:DNA-binding response OmpR family regulator